MLYLLAVKCWILLLSICTCFGYSRRNCSASSSAAFILASLSFGATCHRLARMREKKERGSVCVSKESIASWKPGWCYRRSLGSPALWPSRISLCQKSRQIQIPSSRSRWKDQANSGRFPVATLAPSMHVSNNHTARIYMKAATLSFRVHISHIQYATIVAYWMINKLGPLRSTRETPWP